MFHFSCTFLMWLKQVDSQKWRCDMKMDRRCLLFFNIWQSWDPVRVWWAAIPTIWHSELLFTFPESASSVISCPSLQMRQQSLHKLHCSHLKPNRCSAIPSRVSFHPAWLLFKELISSQEVLVETSQVASGVEGDISCQLCQGASCAAKLLSGGHCLGINIPSLPPHNLGVVLV